MELICYFKEAKWLIVRKKYNLMDEIYRSIVIFSGDHIKH